MKYLKERPIYLSMVSHDGSNVLPAVIDRVRFLEYLAKYCDMYGLNVTAYCLFPDSLHLVATPSKQESVKNTVRMLKTMYSRYMGKKNGNTVSWKRELVGCTLDGLPVCEAARYVETLPVRAGLVDSAEDWPWSSAAAHCGFAHDPLVETPVPDMKNIKDWSAFLKEEPRRNFDEPI